jgi:uncharacterized protein YabN with tetrapyrrole methylase and pyrophosphatase domain
MKETRTGSLTVVGTGIQLGQLTLDARACIEDADKVLFLVADAVTRSWILEVQPTAECLQDCYHRGRRRSDSYLEMVERILSPVRQHLEVCAAFYGHPGVFVRPSHEAIRRARREGYEARMLPGISAEDCLFADLGIDPARNGCRSFEATYFVAYRCKFDRSCPLILWQIGAVGDPTFHTEINKRGLGVLIDMLRREYGAQHEVVLYEAAQYALANPVIKRVPLVRVPDSVVTLGTTLFVPPKVRHRLNTGMVNRLGIPRKSIRKRAAASGRVSAALHGPGEPEQFVNETGRGSAAGTVRNGSH